MRCRETYPRGHNAFFEQGYALSSDATVRSHGLLVGGAVLLCFALTLNEAWDRNVRYVIHRGAATLYSCDLPQYGTASKYCGSTVVYEPGENLSPTYRAVSQDFPSEKGAVQ